MFLLALLSTADACDRFGTVTALRDLQHPDLDESSGLAASRRLDGALWTHDDAGEPELFRFQLDGTVTKHAFPDTNNRDWEDLASASCPRSGDCLYVGDIGSDRSDPTEIEILVGKEPDGDGAVRLVERWVLTWPGAPKDAETLLVHPCTLDAWIVTRDATTEVFKVPDNRGPRAQPLIPVATLGVDAPITGGDFAPDGSALVLRSDATVWRYTLDPGDPDAHWSDVPEVLFTLPQPGEAIVWEADGDVLVTDEGRPTPLGRVTCEDTVQFEVCEASTGCGCQSTRPSWPWFSLSRR